MVDRSSALPGRPQELRVPTLHEVLGTPLKPPFPEGIQPRCSGWAASGARRGSSGRPPGVLLDRGRLRGGYTPNPTYGRSARQTGHAEVVLVVFDRARTSYAEMLQDRSGRATIPTQGMRQGNDVGTQYRSLIYCTTTSAARGRRGLRAAYERGSSAAGLGADHDRDRAGERHRSTTPRTTTSSTSPRTRAATAGSAARASAARSGCTRSRVDPGPGCAAARRGSRAAAAPRETAPSPGRNDPSEPPR